MACPQSSIKIAFIQDPFDNVLPPNQSSIGLWTYHTVRHLPPNCHATIFAKRMFASQLSNEAEQFDLPNVEFRYVTSTPNRIWVKMSRYLSFLGGRGQPPFAALHHYADYILQIALQIRREKFDIIHIHNFTQFVPIVRALNPRARIVLHMHGEWLSQLDPAIVEPRIQRTDAIFGVSKYLTDLIQKRYPRYADVCHTVYNGVDSELFVPKKREPEQKVAPGKHLLFVGRISPEKGIHVLVDAFLIVAMQHPEVRLDILGPVKFLPKEYLVELSNDQEVGKLEALYSGDYLQDLKERIPKHLAGQVNFYGHVAQSELVEHYQAADILINPSISESFGMSLVEAMACEKAVIATHVGGMKEIVKHGTTGLLVERNDAAALADAILKLLSNDEERVAMGQAGRKRVLELFSWDRVVGTTMRKYESLIANRSSSAPLLYLLAINVVLFP